MHRHGAIQVVCETYGAQVLGHPPGRPVPVRGQGVLRLRPGQLGAVPALGRRPSAVLEPSPSRPDVIADAAQKYGATLFFAGPTFFANMLRAGLPADALAGVRLAASAGEALPAALYTRWTSHFGVDILDGIGMTEMLHIFLSNRPGDGPPRHHRRRGARLRPAPAGRERARGASRAPPARCSSGAPRPRPATGPATTTSRQVFQGEWLRTGDTYVQDADGYYTCLGRTGDMLKACGIWVSPAEVEARLFAHQAVAQAVVVAAPDGHGLEKPVAFVICEPRRTVTEAELIEFCRQALPSFKRPRKVVFVTGYPTTATGQDPPRRAAPDGRQGVRAQRPAHRSGAQLGGVMRAALDEGRHPALGRRQAAAVRPGGARRDRDGGARAGIADRRRMVAGHRRRWRGGRLRLAGQRMG